MRKFIAERLAKAARVIGSKDEAGVLRDILIHQEQNNRKRDHPNPFVLYGEKCFSQSDEDGITLEIIRRLGKPLGTFIEFGVGNGLQNNTLILLAQGWKGCWFGGQDIAFRPEPSGRLAFEKVWITRDNIIDLCKAAEKQTQAPDLISVDLDGNDYHLVREMLERKVSPAVFIVEYNAKFIPPTKFVTTYRADHRWGKDDYFGASLASFSALFERFDYAPVCCNAATGANAFFIKKELTHLFPEVPPGLRDIYCSPFYFLPNKVGHQQSVKTIEKMING